MRRISLRIRLAVCLLMLVVIAIGIYRERPPAHVVIEVGPLGGSFHQTALQYQQVLAKRGITLEIRPKANSLEILPDLANPASGVDIGFEAQDTAPFAHAPLFGVGKIQIQPLFVFANADLGRRLTLPDLRGRRIVMPPASSATSDAAVRMFQLYDINPDNSSFTFMPLADAAAALRAGKFDAGAFMLAPENPVVRDLASWSGVRLVSIGEARAIANHLPFLSPITLPRGIYDIADGIPPADVTMIAGTVGVAVRDGLHPSVLYALLEAMTEVHRGPTLVSTAGAFPSMAGTDLPVHPLARDYYLTGVPWIWRNLPPGVAGFLNHYLLVLLTLFVLAELYRLSSYLAEFGASLLTRRRRP